MSSQATSKGATKETRERAERVSVVSGSARATVVAEEDTPSPTPRTNPERTACSQLQLWKNHKAAEGKESVDNSLDTRCSFFRACSSLPMVRTD